MKKITRFFILFALILSLCTVAVYAAKEATPILTFEAEVDGVLGGNAYTYGFKVGNVGKCGTDVEGTVTFEDLDLPEDGTYLLKLYYCSGSDDRNFDIRTDEGNFHIECPNTGSFDTVGTILVEVDLVNGGYMEIGSDWYGPDLDKVEIYHTDAFAFENKVYTDADNETVGLGNMKLVLDKNNGVFSLMQGDTVVLANAHAEIELDGKIIASDMFENHSVEIGGISVTFTHTDLFGFSGKMVQTFTLKDGYVVTRVSVSGVYEMETNFISPISVYQNSVNVENGTFLQMPYDNDMWGEPKYIGVYDLGHTTKGYEVGAYYNAASGAGLVFGSVEHDVWKSGVNINADGGSIMGLTVFGGASDNGTRDKAPHGMVTGTTISSALTFLGYFEDYREGLSAYGKANTDVVPAKQSDTTVPFGFNSWGCFQDAVRYSSMCAVSEYINEYLQPAWGEDTAVYVNIDSYWDYIVKNDATCDMTLDEALAAFAALCAENGQKAGIYFTPFAVWMSEDDMIDTKMEGSDYTFYEAALRLPDGTLYGTLDGGYALDATHPGTIARIKDRINYFISLGFGYLKMDFLTHGALEGDHYDATVKTGTQAYNKAMAEIHALCNGKMVVNLSIAPVFPYQYADGRRISCDAFASLDNTQHVLSYLTACFWHKEIYNYPDPDHLVVWGSYEGTARARVTSGVISGTSFLIGDNLADIAPDTDKHRMIMKMFANSNIIALAKRGAAFSPMEYAPANGRCASLYSFVAEDGIYIAAFNFEDYKVNLGINLSCFENAGSYAAELWTGKRVTVENGTLQYALEASDVAVFKITKTESGLADIKEIEDIEVFAPIVTPDPDPDDKNPESGNQQTGQNPEQEASKTVGLSTMSIVWLCIGGVLLFALVFGIVYFITQKKQK